MEPIARGGFGAVYVAEQLTTERRVALKLLARYAEDVSVERLLAEARVTSRIVSDHIVQVIDAGVDTTEGDVFVVMELLRGATLDDRVLTRGPLTAHETAECLRQIAAGLDKAHGHVDGAGRPTPIVHRDLKPSNIFLTERDDGRPLLKILDFGAAKVLSPTTKTSGVVRGTPQFMACEQALGEPSSPATDIWALGLITFYLLTGRSYWLTVEHDGTEAQLFAEILSLPLAPASQRARQLGVSTALPPAFDAWFARCVNRARDQRFASAGLAAAELARALDVSATPPPGPGLRPAMTKRAPSEPGTAPRALETHDLAALASTPGAAGARRKRAGLITLGIVFASAAGAGAVLWKRSSSVPAAPSSLSATPAAPVSLAPAAPPPTATAASAATDSAKTPGSDAARSAPKSSPPSPPRAERAPPRSKAPPKAATARDPYEQR